MLIEFDHKAIPNKSTFVGKCGAFDTQKKKKNSLKWDVARQMRLQGSHKLVGCAICVHMRIGKAWPKTWSQNRREEVLVKQGGLVITPPDVDNLQKFYLDVIKGIAIEDDRNIAQLSCEKFYADRDFVTLDITEAQQTLTDEIQQLGNMAVGCHAALQEVYEFAEEISLMPGKGFARMGEKLKEICLKGGLEETINDR